MVTPREAELLSYLTGLGPVGTWVFPRPQWLAEDLGINARANMSYLTRSLRELGMIEARRMYYASHRYEYRVLRRLEDGVEIGVRSGRPVGSPNGWRDTCRRAPYAGREYA